MYKQTILKIFYFTVFFPFISVFPINTDLQPIFLIFTFITGITFYDKLILNRNELFLILFGFFSLIYFDVFEIENPLTKGVSSYISLFLSILFLIVFYKTFNIKIFVFTLKVTIIIYFISSLIFYLYPDNFMSFQDRLVRNINTKEEGIGFRGISTYFTEPGIFGAHIISLIILIINFYRKHLLPFSIYVFSSMCLIMIFMSKSGMGYTYLLILITLLFYRKITYFLPFVLVFLYLLLETNWESLLEINRGFQSISELTKIASTTDSSILKRIYDFLLGIFLFIKNPIGYGVNIDIKTISSVINNNSFFSNFYGTNREFGFVSSFSFYLITYGIWFVSFLLFLLKKYKPSLINMTFFFLFISFSFSGAYPMIWVLLIIDDILLKNEHE